MKKKGWITKKILKGMDDLRRIFKEKKNIYNGLMSDEIISLVNNKELKKIRKLSPKLKETRWNEIRTIKKYLIKTEQMAIIFKPLPRGTELYCEEFGKRILERETNIFFRCPNLEQAWGYRSKLDKISKGIELIGEKVVEISESEAKEKEIIKVVNKEHET